MRVTVHTLPRRLDHLHPSKRACLTIKRGRMSTVGRGEKRIPVSSMTALQWKSATVHGRGFIEFAIPGGNERKSTFGSQVSEARQDENRLTFVNSEQSVFERVREAVAEDGCDV